MFLTVCNSITVSRSKRIGTAACYERWLSLLEVQLHTFRIKLRVVNVGQGVCVRLTEELSKWKR